MKKYFLVPAVLLSLLFLFGCGKKTETELYESAQNNIEEKNYIEALSDFKQMLDQYSDGQYAGKAMLEIGKLYHGKVVKNISVNESLKNAVDYYKMVYEKYPDEDGAKQAMFMSGFILANELKDFNAAREIYNQFIEKYPESELAFSAKAELENLGKDPEEILKEKIEVAN